MQIADFIVTARWIIPIEPRFKIIQDGALAVQSGRIVAIGAENEVLRDFSSKNLTRRPDHILMPGLINAHTHSPMALLRGFADDYPLMQWLENYIWPVEKTLMGRDFIYDGTQLAIAEMLKGGTTCFNENYFFAEVIAEATQDCHMRAVIGEAIIDFPSPYAHSLTEYLTKTENIWRAWNHHPLINIAIAPHAPYSVSDESFIAIKKLAEKTGMMIHLHLQETFEEVENSLKHYGKRPLERLKSLGITEHHLQCAHMVSVNEKDLEFLQTINAHVLHCPESNMKLASGFAPVNSMLRHGINVGIGTDGAASNNDLDMFSELRVAAQLAKAVAKDPTAFSAEQALYAATMGGARALRLEQEIGSLTVGKQADFIAIHMAECNTQPLYHPLSHLVYATHSRQVSDAWVAGKALLQNGQLTLLDEAMIKAKANQWQQKIWHYYPARQKAAN